MKLKVQIAELEPGLLLVRFRGPKPPADSRHFWLRQSVTDWLKEHPGRKVERAQPVQHGGELVGLIVSTVAPPRDLPFRVHSRCRLPQEHLEALIQHAYDIYFKDVACAALAVLNRSGVAVVFDGEAGHVLPLDEIGDLDDAAKQAYADWRAKGETSYFVMRLAGGLRR